LLKLTDRCGWQVRQQLRQIALEIDVVRAAGAGQAGRVRRDQRNILADDFFQCAGAGECDDVGDDWVGNGPSAATIVAPD